MNFLLTDILKITNGQVVNGTLEGEIKSIHCFANNIKKDSLFISPYKLKNLNDSLVKAEKLGAVAAIISNKNKLNFKTKMTIISVENTLYALHQIAKAHRRKFPIPIIAITGSNGKTTTKDTLAHVLSAKYCPFKTAGSLNDIVYVPLSLLQLDSSVDIGVIEMGMGYIGQIDLMAQTTEPQIGIITNINESHIAHFHTKANIAKAKGELFKHIPPSGFVMLNGDDEHLRRLAETYEGKVYFYGVDSNGLDIKASNIKTTNNGLRFDVDFEQISIQDIFIPLFGEYNVYNMLPAIFIAHQKGYTADEIKTRLKTLTITNKRFEIKTGYNRVQIVDDAFNANPTSMKRSIETFANLFHDRKKVIVLGDMLELGNASDQAHKEIGEFLNQFKTELDIVITVGRNAFQINESYNGIKKHVNTMQALYKFLKPLLTEERAILFKASRNQELDAVIKKCSVQNGTEKK